ncbi:hypothetical protein, partial [Pseudomonas vranovensis]|uniref:hypothetical protein n=1 Tax=Pseudomonas vranovensis TaxID=321661 RepID=UPI001ADF66EB
SDSWDGGLVEGSWTEGYFSTGQTACADLIGESVASDQLGLNKPGLSSALFQICAGAARISIIL